MKTMKTMKTIITVFFILFSYLITLSQNPVISIKGIITDNYNFPLSGVIVEVESKNLKKIEILTNQHGRYLIDDLEYDYKYILSFKKKNYTTKKIFIDTKTNFIKEDLEAEIEVPINMYLLQKEKGIDYSLIEKDYVAKLGIEETIGLLDYDLKFIKARNLSIDSFLSKNSIVVEKGGVISIAPNWKIGETKTMNYDYVEEKNKNGEIISQEENNFDIKITVEKELEGYFFVNMYYPEVFMKSSGAYLKEIGKEPISKKLLIKLKISKINGNAEIINWKEIRGFYLKGEDKLMNTLNTLDEKIDSLDKEKQEGFEELNGVINELQKLYNKDHIEKLFKDDINALTGLFKHKVNMTDTLFGSGKELNPIRRDGDSIKAYSMVYVSNNSEDEIELVSYKEFDMKESMREMMEEMIEMLSQMLPKDSDEFKKKRKEMKEEYESMVMFLIKQTEYTYKKKSKWINKTIISSSFVSEEKKSKESTYSQKTYLMR
jgi:hypothetical protein